MSKRRRHGSQLPKQSAARPTDKSIIAIDKIANTSQVATVLYTATFPATVVGLRWEIGAMTRIAGNSKLAWCIIHVQDGKTPSTIVTSDAGQMYSPEQSVMTFGFGHLMGSSSAQGNGQKGWCGHTKTMRKMRNGDTLQFIVLSDTANSAEMEGFVQFFTKS